jgi:peptide-methionine (S)-S-oxide reductase
MALNAPSMLLSADNSVKPAKPELNTSIAVFAGGCFWCMQPPFDSFIHKGVISTRVGYTGGTKNNPTYSEVSGGGTGHFEATEVTFDPQKITYKNLLKIFWENIDPFDKDGEFCDKGSQYKSAVFYLNESQKQDYLDSKIELEKSEKFKGKITTQLTEFKKFYPAEEYHQSYYKKNPIRYHYYRHGCGRDKRLSEIWGTSH